jgi:hypothetical protein
MVRIGAFEDGVLDVVELALHGLDLSSRMRNCHVLRQRLHRLDRLLDAGADFDRVRILDLGDLQRDGALAVDARDRGFLGSPSEISATWSGRPGRWRGAPR